VAGIFIVLVPAPATTTPAEGGRGGEAREKPL
jgi:hypothetical protein